MEFKYQLTLPQPVVKDVVRAVVSTILFHRLLGSVIPQTREALGISYPVVMGDGAGEIDSLVEEKASTLVRALGDGRVSGTGKQRTASIAIRFVDQTAEAGREAKGTNISSGGWFGTRATTTEDQYKSGDAGGAGTGSPPVSWETWILTIKISDTTSSGGSSSGGASSGGSLSSQGMMKTNKSRMSEASELNCL